MLIVTFDRERYALFTRWDWHRLLELAELGDWWPRERAPRLMLMESRPAREPVEITAVDARHLADALERTLLDIPNHDCADAKAPAVRHASGAVCERVVFPGETLSVLEDLSGPRKELVRDWVKLIREGGGFTVKDLGLDGNDPPWWESD